MAPNRPPPHPGTPTGTPPATSPGARHATRPAARPVVRPNVPDDEALLASINTTPLVDVMLVLLIIFLITIPVVTHSVPVQLPLERVQPAQPRPDTIVLAVDRAGGIWWNTRRVPDAATLLAELQQQALRQPQPEVQLRGDQQARYAMVGRVLAACQRAGITQVGIITEPPAAR